jgi:hypothetical protein
MISLCLDKCCCCPSTLDDSYIAGAATVLRSGKCVWEGDVEVGSTTDHYVLVRAKPAEGSGQCRWYVGWFVPQVGSTGTSWVPDGDPDYWMFARHVPGGYIPHNAVPYEWSWAITGGVGLPIGHYVGPGDEIEVIAAT